MKKLCIPRDIVQVISLNTHTLWPDSLTGINVLYVPCESTYNLLMNRNHQWHNFFFSGSRPGKWYLVLWVITMCRRFEKSSGHAYQYSCKMVSFERVPVNIRYPITNATWTFIMPRPISEITCLVYKCASVDDSAQ